jgi:hypothetical protein
MRELITTCGKLHGVVFDQYYGNGQIKECTLVDENIVNTPLGAFIPQYEDDGLRRKFNSSLSFYQRGALRKLSLQEKSFIQTPIGKLSAELITFYESGALKRVFPLNGKLSGYWSEKNEYGLAQEITLDFPFGRICARLICIHFYESGAVKSLTFWPQEKPVVKTPCGEMAVRIGISLYESGAIHSLEPQKPFPVKTPIGVLTAFDLDAIGVTGDANSLVFAQNGAVSSLKTTKDSITVYQKSGDAVGRFEPALVLSHFSDDQPAVEPLELSFENGNVCFNHESCFNTAEYRFDITKFDRQVSGNQCGGKCDVG